MKKDSLDYLTSLPALLVPTEVCGCLVSLPFGVKQITLNDYDWAEFGVGISTTVLISLIPDNVLLYMFDSLEGLPEDWFEFSADHMKGTFGRTSQREYWENMKNFYAGWFADTLPEFAANREQPFGFIHMDCDLYTSTRDVLFSINKLIVPSTIIVFDEYYNYGGDKWKKHEYRAFMEYVTKFNREFEYVGRTNQFQVIVRIVK